MNIGSVGNSQMMTQMRQMQQQMQQLRQDADVDGSEGLNMEEFTSLRGEVSELTGKTSSIENVEEAFAAIDADGSGELSSDEMQSFHQQKMEGMGGKPPPPRGGPPPGGMMSADMNSTLLLFQEVESDSETDDTSVVDTLFSNDEETEETSSSTSILDALYTEDEATAA